MAAVDALGSQQSIQQTEQLRQAAEASAAAQNAPRVDQAAVNAAQTQYQQAVGEIGDALQRAQAEFKTGIDSRQPTLLKSRALFRAFKGVCSRLEAALHLQKGRLTPAFMNRAFIRQTEAAVTNGKVVLDRMGELNELLEKPPAAGAGDAAYRAQVNEKFQAVQDSLEAFDDKVLNMVGMSEDEANRFAGTIGQISFDCSRAVMNTQLVFNSPAAGPPGAAAEGAAPTPQTPAAAAAGSTQRPDAASGAAQAAPAAAVEENPAVDPSSPLGVRLQRIAYTANDVNALEARLEQEALRWGAELAGDTGAQRTAKIDTVKTEILRPLQAMQEGAKRMWEASSPNSRERVAAVQLNDAIGAAVGRAANYVGLLENGENPGYLPVTAGQHEPTIATLPTPAAGAVGFVADCLADSRALTRLEKGLAASANECFESIGKLSGEHSAEESRRLATEHLLQLGETVVEPLVALRSNFLVHEQDQRPNMSPAELRLQQRVLADVERINAYSAKLTEELDASAREGRPVDFSAALAVLGAAENQGTAEIAGVDTAPAQAPAAAASTVAASGPAAAAGPVATDAERAVLQDLQPTAQRLRQMEKDLDPAVLNLVGIVGFMDQRDKNDQADQLTQGFRAPLEAISRDLRERIAAAGDNPPPALTQMKEIADGELARLDPFLQALRGGGEIPNALAPRAANAPTAFAVLADMRAQGVKLDSVHIDINDAAAVTDTHYCSAPSPGRPAELNPLFYHERQSKQLCLKHALNNCLGGEAFTDQGLADAIRNEQVRQKRAEIDMDPQAVVREWQGLFPEGRLTVEYLQGNPDAAAELLADTYIDNMMLAPQGAANLVDFVQTGNQVEVGLFGLRQRAGELGLPEAELQSFLGAGQEDAMLDYLRETEGRVDRMVLGNMTHFLSFRKNADGDWFMLNSNMPEQIRQSPSEYVREHPIGQLGTTMKQYQFLTFAGEEFVPNVAPHETPPLGAGHLRV